ncbi:uncharacterized protein N7479_009756 [Penicillium vulpinum]|uniref:uncharacterized protein n=1 Tax=Penicillium vulpinum TaxID=29845 RepID=UPI002548CFDA|nr:uncharacterized protein N7479_009756 [Penicillium vulpinum]KAJ5951343.1 hypothetical protein N7479_009756 [Penicillium vulpinum]
MYYLKSTLPFVVVATALVSADTAKTTTLTDSVVSTACASGKILQQCIQSMQSDLENCEPNDWNCLCTSSTNLVNCYNNCLEDPLRKDAQSTLQQSCANAKSYGITARAATTSSNDIDDGTYISESDVENDFQDGRPRQSYSGLEVNSIRPEKGTASVLRIGGWLGCIGLALGVIF